MKNLKVEKELQILRDLGSEEAEELVEFITKKNWLKGILRPF